MLRYQPRPRRIVPQPEKVSYLLIVRCQADIEVDSLNTAALPQACLATGSMHFVETILLRAGDSLLLPFVLDFLQRATKIGRAALGVKAPQYEEMNGNFVHLSVLRKTFHVLVSAEPSFQHSSNGESYI